MTLDWTKQPVRFFQHLLRETDAIGLDPKSLIEEARDLGANAYLAMGGGFSAWYPTKLASQTINPHLQGDFLAELLAAAKAVEMRVLVRMDISKGREGTEHANPDWFVRRPDGAIGMVWGMPQICATGPFWRRENFAIIDELLERYDFDGFFYNYLYVARCYCDRCQHEVMRATGAAVPDANVRSPAYEQWRQATLAEYVGRMRQFIQARNPRAALVPYHHVRDGWDIAAMAAVSDLIGVQASNPVVPNPIDPQPMWNHWAAEEALKARALKPGSAPLLIQSTSEFFASRQTALPNGRLLHNLAMAAAHGASTAPAINGTLNQDDPRFIPALKAFGAYMERNKHWYDDLGSLARVAIMRSEASLNWGPDAGRLAGNPSNPGHVAEFRGFYEAVSALRYSCDVVLTGGLTQEALARYDLVILPAISCLSPADAAAIDAYVAEGGHILASSDLAAFDEVGQAHQISILNALPGLPGPVSSAVGAYFEIIEDGLRNGLSGVPHIGASGDFWIPELSNDAGAKDLRLIGPFANNAPEFTVVKGPGTHPGLIGKVLGKGMAHWLPWRVGALYNRYGIPEYQALIGHLVTRAIGPAPILTTASAAVDFTLYAHPGGMVLHIFNGASVQGRPLIDTTPLAGFDVAVRTDASQAISLDTGQPIPSRRDGANLVIQIDRLDTFVAIALPANAQTHPEQAPGQPVVTQT